MSNLPTLLTSLSSIPGPSGFEHDVARRAVELMRPLTDEAYVDGFGNACGILRGTQPGAARIVIAAHLDEIGFIATGVEQGFLRFSTIGSVDPRMLPGREVTVMTDPPIPGVITCLPPHVLSEEEMDLAFPREDLFIDVGFFHEETVTRIPVGTPAVYRAGCFPLGEDLFCGKAMDDRACFCAGLLALEMLQNAALPHDVVLLGTTREETNFGGAKTGTFALDPDVCLALDVTHAETPDGGPKNTDCVLGGGPAVGYGPNMTSRIRDALIAAANAENIDIQREVMPGKSYTDAWEMQVSREGIPTAILSLPTRYMHTPMETISLSDLRAMADLLVAFLKQPHGEEVAE